MRFRRRESIRPTIPSVAMADLAFLLLVFFACTTVLRRQQHEPPPLPRAALPESIDEEPAARLIVDGKGIVFSEERQLATAELPAFLRTRIPAGSDPVVLLEVDRALRCASVAPILETLRASGVGTVCFAVQLSANSR